MKKFFSKASLMLMALALVVGVTSCNSYDVTETKEVKAPVKNSLRGVILDQDGMDVAGATVTVNGTPVTVTGNTFESLGLDNGSYTIVVKAAGYKDSEPKTVTLSTSKKTIDGKTVTVGQDEQCAIYLVKDATSLVKFGAGGDTQSIVLETSQQNDGTGNIVGNTQDPSDATLNSEITTTAETPGLTASEVTKVEQQMPSGKTITDLSFTLTNLNSLADATRATRAIIVAGEALPGKYTFFTGVRLDTEFTIDFSTINPNLTVDVSFEMPNDVKDLIKVYRNVGSGWTEINSSSTGNGIKSVSYDEDGKIVVHLNVLKKQAFAIGVLIDRSEETSSTETFTAGPLMNTTPNDMTVTSMNYKVKSKGVVITNLTKGSMVDYLRKIIVRYYNLRAISEAEDETLTYVFNPAYSLVSNGQLFLTGMQNLTSSVFKVANGTSSFKVEHYGAVFVYPYAIVPDVPSVHGGGSND